MGIFPINHPAIGNDLGLKTPLQTPCHLENLDHQICGCRTSAFCEAAAMAAVTKEFESGCNSKKFRSGDSRGFFCFKIRESTNPHPTGPKLFTLPIIPSFSHN